MNGHSFHGRVDETLHRQITERKGVSPIKPIPDATTPTRYEGKLEEQKCNVSEAVVTVYTLGAETHMTLSILQAVVPDV